MQISAGAVDEAKNFLYNNQAAPSRRGAFRFAGRSFTLDAYRYGTRIAGLQFPQSVRLIIESTDDDVVGLVEQALTNERLSTTKTDCRADEIRRPCRVIGASARRRPAGTFAKEGKTSHVK